MEAATTGVHVAEDLNTRLRFMPARRGFAGLEGLVRTVLSREPLNGDIFVFVNRSGKHLKCLFWDRTQQH